MLSLMLAPMLASSALVTPAWAQDEDEESDDFLEESDADKGKKSSSSRGRRTTGEVREIVRGFYGKSDVGGAFYVGNFSAAVNGGTYVALGVGQDFVDNERMSMAWEVQLWQGLHNGADFVTQASAGCGVGAPCTEGDLRTYSLVASYEYSAYVTRRVGIGGRAGVGVLYSPLLMNRAAYETDVLPAFGGEPGLHDSPKPLVMVGPTFEYYTKLSHFSVGVDVDAFYGIGWDVGVNAAGYLKYTF